MATTVTIECPYCCGECWTVSGVTTTVIGSPGCETTANLSASSSSFTVYNGSGFLDKVVTKK